MRDFVCPDCGAVIRNDTSKNRKYCPRCSYKYSKLNTIEHQKRTRREIKESTRIKKASTKNPEPIDTPIADAKKQADLEQNQRVKMQRKQCRECKYRWHDDANGITKGCQYILKTGHMRDRGEGPGKCGSFEPLTRKETKAERVRRALKNLRSMEADNADLTGTGIRKVNT